MVRALESMCSSVAFRFVLFDVMGCSFYVDLAVEQLNSVHLYTESAACCVCTCALAKRSHDDEYLTLPFWSKAIGFEGCAFSDFHRYFRTAVASISKRTPSAYSRVTGINVLAGG